MCGPLSAAAQPADDPAAEPPDQPPEPDRSAEDSLGQGSLFDRPARRYGLFSGDFTRAEPTPWTIAFEPKLWYAAPGGDLEIGDGGLTDLGELNIDSPALSPKGEFHLRRGRWTVSLGGSVVETSGGFTATSPLEFGGLLIDTGERARGRITIDSAEAVLGYRLWEHASRPGMDGRPGFFGRFDLTGGLRFYDVGFSVERLTGPPGLAEAGIVAVHPIVGARIGFEFGDRSFVEADVNVGGLPEIGDVRSSSVSVQVSLGYRPIDPVSIQVGYRLRTSVLEEDADEYDGAIAGLFAGFVFRH